MALRMAVGQPERFVDTIATSGLGRVWHTACFSEIPILMRAKQDVNMFVFINLEHFSLHVAI